MGNQNSDNEILDKIEREYEEYYVKKKELPKPFYNEDEKSKIKVIVLGCDPTINEIVTKGEDVYLEKVFGLGDKDRELLKGRSENYFKNIRKNLEALGIDATKEIYIQNLCKNYLNTETSEFFKNSKVYNRYIYMNQEKQGKNRHLIKEEYNNNKWFKISKLWISNLKEELSQFNNNIPVLLTSQYQILLLVGPDKYNYIRRAYDLYKTKTIIKAKDNELGRTLIPFFRHNNYLLHRNEFVEYKNFIKKVIDKGIIIENL